MCVVCACAIIRDSSLFFSFFPSLAWLFLLDYVLNCARDVMLFRVQVEYYFSDSNLPWDEHLLARVQVVGGGGYVDLKHILSFKRMLEHLGKSIKAAELGREREKEVLLRIGEL